MTPKLFEAMRRAARARRNVEAAGVELDAARLQEREAHEALTTAAGEDTGVGRRLVQARRRVQDARIALATAQDMKVERDDELALALFAEYGLPPSSDDLPAELRSRLAVVAGGRS